VDPARNPFNKEAQRSREKSFLQIFGHLKIRQVVDSRALPVDQLNPVTARRFFKAYPLQYFFLTAS
jgi:hypothetical protein